MNRDNLLFALAGVLVGFVVAYFSFEVVADRQPPRLNAAQAAAAAQAQAGQPDSAPQRAPFLERMAQLEEFVRENPDNAEAVTQLGNGYFDMQNWSAAAATYETALALQPGSPDILVDYGVSLRNLGRHEEALAKFRQALDLAPQQWQALFNQVVVLGIDLGRFDEAERVLDELRKLQPDNPDVERLAAAVAERKKAAA